MKKFDRVIAILVFLQSRKVVLASSIAERFEVSLRTVYRDIATLKSAGVPISGNPGIGYSILEGYRLPPLMINEQEATALLTAEKFIGKFTDAQTQQHYSNALLKIRAILRSAEKQSLAALDHSIAIADAPGAAETPHLPMLFRSIADKRTLHIHYQKADGTDSERLLEPVGCYHQLDAWYLIAFCQLKGDYRTFKVSRMVRLELLDQHFTTHHIALQDYIKRQEEAWNRQRDIQVFEVAFTVPYARFADLRKVYFGFVDQWQEGDMIHMKFVNDSVEFMARWLMQFGNQATVIAPPALQDRL